MFTENENDVVLAVAEVEEGVIPAVTTPAEVIAPEEPEMITGMVTDCTKLNVRTGPGATEPVVCTIPHGTEVMVLEEDSTEEFCKVYTASGVEGFCMRKYIAINP